MGSSTTQAQRAPSRLLTLLAVIALLAVAAAGFVAASPGRAGRLLGRPTGDWHRAPRPSAPPAVLPTVPADAPVPTKDGLERVLAPLLADPRLGTRLNVTVIDPAAGTALFSRGADASTVPASTAKLVTAATALAARGPGYRIVTKAVAGSGPGEVVLVGAGDPTLAGGPEGAYPDAARLDDLAAQVKQALGGTAPSRVVIDTGLYTGPTLGPGWDADIPTGGSGANITALMIDGARVNPKQNHGPAARSAQPDLAAGQQFAKLLGLPAGAVVRGSAPAGARELGNVSSPPLSRLVEFMLTESDNIVAEALARQVALARQQPASFEGGAAAMRTVVGELGLPADQYGLVDGSGLSRLDRASPALLAGVLALASRPDRVQLRQIFSGLPVSGYSGTLRDRYRQPSSTASTAGTVRAKTGTLSGVSSIAGIVVDADGRTLVFAALADGLPMNYAASLAAQEPLDKIASALAACGCR